MGIKLISANHQNPWSNLDLKEKKREYKITITTQEIKFKVNYLLEEKDEWNGNQSFNTYKNKNEW